MSTILIAEFADANALIGGGRDAGAHGCRVLDAFTPFPVEGLNDLVVPVRSHVRLVMFIGGVAVAAFAYGIEFYSAVVDYPINSGGRPFHSWPAFMLFPFAVGIFGAAVAGFAALLVQTGLPRLHHPLFAIDGFEQASQDRFLLAVEAPSTDLVEAARSRLREGGAIAVREVAP